MKKSSWILISIVAVVIILGIVYASSYTNILGAPLSSVTCTDSDGGINYFSFGTVNYAGANYNDLCSGAKLSERYCKESGKIGNTTKYVLATSTYTYPYKCLNGACAQKCTDSDGGLNYSVRGTTTGIYAGTNGFSTDYCTTNGTFNGQPVNLVEFACFSDTDYTSYPYNCSNGCVDGACVNKTA